MKRILFCLLAVMLLCISAQAKYTQTCKVKYETQDGWSKVYTVTVIFLTGQELNTATNSYNYKYGSVYAVIFWGDNKATIIKSKDHIGCYDEASHDCIVEGRYSDYEGLDQRGVRWVVCVKDYCSL